MGHEEDEDRTREEARLREDKAAARAKRLAEKSLGQPDIIDLDTLGDEEWENAPRENDPGNAGGAKEEPPEAGPGEPEAARPEPGRTEPGADGAHHAKEADPEKTGGKPKTGSGRKRSRKHKGAKPGNPGPAGRDGAETPEEPEKADTGAGAEQEAPRGQEDGKALKAAGQAQEPPAQRVQQQTGNTGDARKTADGHEGPEAENTGKAPSAPEGDGDGKKRGLSERPEGDGRSVPDESLPKDRPGDSRGGKKKASGKSPEAPGKPSEKAGPAEESREAEAAKPEESPESRSQETRASGEGVTEAEPEAPKDAGSESEPADAAKTAGAAKEPEARAGSRPDAKEACPCPAGEPERQALEPDAGEEAPGAGRAADGGAAGPEGEAASSGGSPGAAKDSPAKPPEAGGKAGNEAGSPPELPGDEGGAQKIPRGESAGENEEPGGTAEPDKEPGKEPAREAPKEAPDMPGPGQAKAAGGEEAGGSLRREGPVDTVGNLPGDAAEGMGASEAREPEDSAGPGGREQGSRGSRKAEAPEEPADGAGAGPGAEGPEMPGTGDCGSGKEPGRKPDGPPEDDGESRDPGDGNRPEDGREKPVTSADAPEDNAPAKEEAADGPGTAGRAPESCREGGMPGNGGPEEPEGESGSCGREAVAGDEKDPGGAKSGAGGLSEPATAKTPEIGEPGPGEPEAGGSLQEPAPGTPQPFSDGQPGLGEGREAAARGTCGDAEAWIPENAGKEEAAAGIQLPCIPEEEAGGTRGETRADIAADGPGEPESREEGPDAGAGEGECPRAATAAAPASAGRGPEPKGAGTARPKRLVQPPWNDPRQAYDPRKVLEALPEADTLFCLFGGNMAVPANAPCRRVVGLERNPSIVRFYDYVLGHTAEEVAVDVNEWMEFFSPLYAGKSMLGEIVNFYNTESDTGALLFVIACIARGRVLRFKDYGKAAAKYKRGSLSWEGVRAEALLEFRESLADRKARVIKGSFKNVSLKAGKGDLIYAEPPSILDDPGDDPFLAWSEEDEEKLFAFLDRKDGEGVPFAVTATLAKGRKTDVILRDWMEGYRVLRVTRGQGKRPSDRSVFLVTNR